MERRTGVVETMSQRADCRLRTLEKTLICNLNDPIIPARLIDRYNLRQGVEISVEIGASRGLEGSKKKKKKSKTQKELAGSPRVENILLIEGQKPEEFKAGRLLEEQTSIHPQPMMNLEYPGCPPACRLIDLFCPLGYGTRGLIVSPPKAGKTTLLGQIATAVEKNHPQCIVFALLIDERPEEVTDFRRNFPCEVLASSNDHGPEDHCNLAMMTVERAKRLAEQGKNVVILLDSLTRVGRAFNNAPSLINSGRTLSGGIDAKALSIPKQLFGSARKIEDGGSLTIMATALVDTGSRGDQLIFEEFKGTGNMELILDRDVANHRVYPAINLAASGTRNDQLLMSPEALETVNALRRRLMNMKPVEQVQQLLKALEKFETNEILVGGTSQARR